MSSSKDPSSPPADAALDEAAEAQKLHELLMRFSREEDAKVAEREAAIAKNRARALQLLAVLEKSQA